MGVPGVVGVVGSMSHMGDGIKVDVAVVVAVAVVVVEGVEAVSNCFVFVVLELMAERVVRLSHLWWVRVGLLGHGVRIELRTGLAVAVAERFNFRGGAVVGLLKNGGATHVMFLGKGV